MYYLDLKGLKQHLQTSRVTTKESFQYLFGLAAFYSFSSVLGQMVQQGDDQGPISLGMKIGLGAFSFVLSIAIIYFILNWYYTCNGGDKGTDFLGRLLMVMFVVTVRFYPFVLVLLIMIAIFKGNLMALMLMTVLSLAITVYVIYLIGDSLRDIHNYSKVNELQV